MTDNIRVGVIDDHPLLRGGVITTLNQEAGIEVVAEGGCCDEAVAIALEHMPDLMLVDVSMPGGGIEAARRIGEIAPAIRIVMLTVSEDEQDVANALQAGACGYLLKGVSGPDLIKAVRHIDAGGHYVSPNFAAKLLSARRAEAAPASDGPMIHLTLREEQILQRVAEGLSNQEIGDLLSLREKTIKSYMTNILQKLQVSNRVQAAVIAIANR